MKKGPRRLKVNSPRNSYCGSAKLNELDFTSYFTDNSLGQFYLHVDHYMGSDYGGTHRVFCKHAVKPRLMSVKGELYWLIDKTA